MRILIIFAALMLAGCNDDDNSGLTESDVQQLIAPLEARIVTLESEVTALESADAGLSTSIATGDAQLASDLADAIDVFESQIDANAPGDRVAFATTIADPNALVAPEMAIGTLMGYTNVDPVAADGVSVKLDSGYVARFRIDRTPSGPITYLEETLFPMYASDDCGVAGDDTPYLQASRVGVQAQRQGMVVRLPDNESLDPDITNVWYVEPGTAVVTLDMRSRLGSDCQILNPAGGENLPVATEVIPILRNDPVVTGVPNEQWDGVPVIGRN